MIRLLLFFVIAVTAFIYASPVKAQPVEGSVSKEIILPNTNNEDVALSSLRGKVVLIDFWASWCRPCRQTVPGLKKLYGEYHSRGFEIYGISLDENKSAWKTAINQDQSRWIHVNDNLGKIASQWNISFIPSTFLLNKNGKIVAINEEPKTLSKYISKLIEEQN